MKNIPLYLAVSLMLLMSISGCKIQQKTSSVTVEKQSYSLVEKVRLDTITIPGDTIFFETQLECDSNLNVKPIYFKQGSKRANLQGTVFDNRLKAMFSCEEFKKELILKDSIINSYQYRSDSTVTVTTKQIPYIPKMYKGALGIVCIELLLLLIYLIYKGIRLYLKINPL